MPASDARDWFFFDGRERELVASVLSVVERADPAVAALLEANLGRLGRLAEVVRDSPAIVASWPSARRVVDLEEALIDLLCRVPDYDVDLHVPTKAVVGQAYVVAKINLLKSLGYALITIDGAAALREAVQSEVGQSIYSKMAEELFLSILTDPDGERGVKRSAGRCLIRIWDDRLLTEVDDVAPLLESTWAARNRVRPTLGTMIGAHEISRLLCEGPDERFLDHFFGDDVPAEQIAAFEEFLFGLSYEQIVRLRGMLAESTLGCISTEQARRILDAPADAWALASGGEGPQAMYTSYKHRRAMAGYRVRTAAPGPKKTAEEYVMTAFLHAEAGHGRSSRTSAPPAPQPSR